jgi:hypothetical protein
MKKHAVAPVLLLAAFALAGGCSSDNATSPSSSTTPSPNSSTTPAPAGGKSTLRVYLTDKPAEEYLAVNVTITAVRVHQSSDVGEAEAGWQELPVTAAMPVDLLQLRNGVVLQLCQVQLPAGHYQQVRLQLAPQTGSEPPFSQSVVTADGVTHALEVPSGSIKIVHGISADAQGVTDLTLDFDAAKSVKKRGEGTYFMTPVITAQN